MSGIENKPPKHDHGLRSRDLVSPAWRECSLTRIAELESLLTWLRQRDPGVAQDPLGPAVEQHLQAARQAASGAHSVRARITGSVAESARSNIDAAEATLLRMAPPGYLMGQLPSLLNGVHRHLQATDPRRVRFEQLAEQLTERRLTTANEQPPATPFDLSEQERGAIVSAVRAASSEALREQQRVRSFRNVLAVTAVAMTLIAIGIAVLGFTMPATIPMCFQPEVGANVVVVCPTSQQVVPQSQPSAADVDRVVRDTVTPQDLFVIELIGLAAAAVAAAMTLRTVRGTSEPYGLPIALALLKLPLGAMTAFLGLLLLRGQFVPGLSNLDTPAQIVAWALVLGYAQQLFTRLVDKQAHTVLDAVRQEPDPLHNPLAPDPAMARPSMGPSAVTSHRAAAHTT